MTIKGVYCPPTSWAPPPRSPQRYRGARGGGHSSPVSWPGGCGGKAGAGQSPPRRRSFPPNVATTGTRPPAHLATWGPAPGTSAPPPADTSTGAGLQEPRPVFITRCHSSGKEIRCQIFLVLSFMVNNRTWLNQYKDRKDGSGEYPHTVILYLYWCRYVTWQTLCWWPAQRECWQSKAPAQAGGGGGGALVAALAAL